MQFPLLIQAAVVSQFMELYYEDFNQACLVELIMQGINNIGRWEKRKSIPSLVWIFTDGVSMVRSPISRKHGALHTDTLRLRFPPMVLGCPVLVHSNPSSWGFFANLSLSLLLVNMRPQSCKLIHKDRLLHGVPVNRMRLFMGTQITLQEQSFI